MDRETKVLTAIGAGVVLPVALAGAVVGYMAYGIGAAIVGAVLAVVVAAGLASFTVGAYQNRGPIIRWTLGLAAYLALVYVVVESWNTQL